MLKDLINLVFKRDQKGISVCNEYGVEYIEVNFMERGRLLTQMEEFRLYENAIISYVGLKMNQNPTQYSIFCPHCFINKLFKSLDDIKKWQEGKRLEEENSDKSSNVVVIVTTCKIIFLAT